MTPARSRKQRMRGAVGPLMAIGISVALLVAPEPFRLNTARWLELTVFLPFRWSVGWGPGTLEARWRLRQLTGERTQDQLVSDRAREIAEENARLRQMLGFRRRAPLSLEPATVVGRERGRLGSLLFLEPVPGVSVEEGTPVLVPDGLLGRTRPDQGGPVEVECLAHRRTAVSVLDQRSREAGILRWDAARADRLVVAQLAVQADWAEGDRVVTSGLGTIFPRGLLVGWVERVEREPTGPLKRAWVRPAASPARAEEVFFLVSGHSVAAETKRESPLSGVDSAGVGRASPGDSLGNRLFPPPIERPPDSTEASVNAAGGEPGTIATEETEGR